MLFESINANNRLALVTQQMGPTRWKPIPLPEGFGAGLALQDLEEILQQKSSKENIHVFLRATLGFIVEPAKPNAQEI